MAFICGECGQEHEVPVLKGQREILCIDTLRGKLESANRQVRDIRKECAEIARNGGCNSAGCDPRGEDGSKGHSNLCPVGIAEAILKSANRGT